MTGLQAKPRMAMTEESADYTCHELTRERIAAWMQTQPEERRNRDEKKIGTGYAERWAALFGAWFHQNQDAALEMGRRALVGFVRAGAYDQLGGFASNLIVSTRDPRVLNALRPSLEVAAAQAPAGQMRWGCCGLLADVLRQAGQYEASLGLYAEAEAEARAQGHWVDVASITGNWANALSMAGKLDESCEKRQVSAEAERRAGGPEINALASQLEALRIAIMQGQAAGVLESIEASLARIEDWQRRAEARENVPQAPDREIRLRALISALDIAKEAHIALKQWPQALAKIERIIEVKRFAGRAELEIAQTRVNRAVMLQALKDYGPAQAELENLLELFDSAGDHCLKAKILGTLASLFDDLGDANQAVTQERRALELSKDCEDVADRAISHNNLAAYLNKTGTTTESANHQLAALAYRLAAGLRQDLQTSLRNYAILYRQAQAAGTELAVPRLADLLARPAFAALNAWLQQDDHNPAKLQAAIDKALKHARQQA
ncbi:hypothetical protein MYXO_03130 [Myxococcaceae bacterium]|nr:hypothetical protein MYXO_03130 [Myxococcaceae bacterium]